MTVKKGVIAALLIGGTLALGACADGYSSTSYSVGVSSYDGPGYYGRGYRDRDWDGIPNRFDRDRDGDGVPNRWDSAPGNPRWR